MKNLFISSILALSFLFMGDCTFGQDEGPERIYEQGATELIDGSVEVTGVIKGDKYLEAVEVSTPTTPAANHVRLFAVAQGTHTYIKAVFDDGTVKVITNN